MQQMILRIFLLLILLVMLMSSQSPSTAHSLPHVRGARTKRGIVWDFLKKVSSTKNLVVDQYRDSKNTLNEIFDLLNEEFPDALPTMPSQTKQNQTNSSGDVQEEPYNISRYELGQIIGKNLRGLKNVGDIEFKDAFNASKATIAEYRKEAKKVFKDKKHKGLKELKSMP